MELFKNAQWQVTDEYVQRADGEWDYFFGIERVFEIADHRGPTKLYDWPVHMAEKTWVDVGSFNEAFEHAIRFQADRTGTAIDEDMLAASYAEANRIRSHRGS